MRTGPSSGSVRSRALRRKRIGWSCTTSRAQRGVVARKQARAAVGVARERRQAALAPGHGRRGPVLRAPLAVGLHVLALEAADVDVVERRARPRRARRPAGRAGCVSVSRVRAKRVCTARSSGACAKRGASAAAAILPAAESGTGHARIAVEQAEAVVDAARVADEREAALLHGPDGSAPECRLKYLTRRSARAITPRPAPGASGARANSCVPSHVELRTDPH